MHVSQFDFNEIFLWLVIISIVVLKLICFSITDGSTEEH